MRILLLSLLPNPYLVLHTLRLNRKLCWSDICISPYTQKLQFVVCFADKYRLYIILYIYYIILYYIIFTLLFCSLPNEIQGRLLARVQQERHISYLAVHQTN